MKVKPSNSTTDARQSSLDSITTNSNGHQPVNRISADKKVPRSCLNSDRVLRFDQFGQPLNFNFHHGNSEFRSVTGSCISLLILLLTLVFTLAQIIVLYRYNGTIFTQSEVLDYLDDDFVFEEKDGLHFAVGIFDRNDNPENIALLHQIFSLKAVMADATDEQKPIKEMQFYKCTQEDYDKFYPVTRS